MLAFLRWLSSGGFHGSCPVIAFVSILVQVSGAAVTFLLKDISFTGILMGAILCWRPGMAFLY
jgi:hypothetical protein